MHPFPTRSRTWYRPIFSGLLLATCVFLNRSFQLLDPAARHLAVGIIERQPLDRLVVGLQCFLGPPGCLVLASLVECRGAGGAQLAADLLHAGREPFDTGI